MKRDNRWVSVVMMVWAMGLITFSTYQLYTQLEAITPTVGTIHTLTIGILTTASGVFLKLRGVEDVDIKKPRV